MRRVLRPESIQSRRVTPAPSSSTRHLAACTNRINVITLLVEAGCDLGALDGNGRTPLSYAESHLRLLRSQPTHEQAVLYRDRVDEIVRLLRAYLMRAGRKDMASDVDQLSARLKTSATVVRAGPGVPCV